MGYNSETKKGGALLLLTSCLHLIHIATKFHQNIPKGTKLRSTQGKVNMVKVRPNGHIFFSEWPYKKEHNSTEYLWTSTLVNRAPILLSVTVY